MRLIDAKPGMRMEWRDPSDGRLTCVMVVRVGKRNGKRFAAVQRLADDVRFRIEEGDTIAWADDAWTPVTSGGMPIAVGGDDDDDGGARGGEERDLD